MIEPKTLAEWEADGALRFLHGDKIPYPTRDVYGEEVEAAFAMGFAKAKRKEELARDNINSPHEFD